MVIPVGSPHVLAIGSHPDDIEIGCGGFVRRLITEFGAVVRFLVLTEGRHSKEGMYEGSTRRKEAIDAAVALGVKPEHVEVLRFMDCGLHECGHEMIGEIERRIYHPDYHQPLDIVLTHAAEDTHADHREVHEASISALRDFNGTVLLYQAPSTKPNLFRPTFFVNLTEQYIKEKNAALQMHESQKHKPFMKLARTVGLASSWALFHRSTAQYCEAFEVYKSFYL